MFPSSFRTVILSTILFCSTTIGLAEKFQFQPASDVDENLFALRVLGQLYQRWPTDFTDRTRAAREISEIRQNAARQLAISKIRKHDDQIPRLFEKLIELSAEYENMLIDFGVIDSQSVNELNQQNADDLTEGAVKGAGTLWLMGSGVMTPLGGGLTLGGIAIRQGFENYFARKKLDARKKADYERRLNAYLIKRAKVLTEASVWIEVLSEKHRWDKGQAGFDQEAERRNSGTPDLQILLKKTKQLLKIRPQDPFVWASRGHLMLRNVSAHEETSVESCQEASRCYLKAARYVPESSHYDRYRASSLYYAAYSEYLALACKSPQAKSMRAYNIALEALKYDPKDSGAKIRFVLAASLGRAGSFARAIQSMKEIEPYHNDKSLYFRRLSWMQSEQEQYDEALQSLTRCIELGYVPIRNLLRTPDLSELRKARPSEFGKITGTRWDWEIDYGFFSNDLLIKNTSRFPLTSVYYRVETQSDEGDCDVTILWVNSIKSGQTLRWKSVLDETSKKHVTHKQLDILAQQNRSLSKVPINSLTGKYEGDYTQASWPKLKADKSGPGFGLTIDKDERTNKTLATVTFDEFMDSYRLLSYQDNMAKFEGAKSTLVLFVHHKTLYGHIWLKEDHPGKWYLFWVKKET